MIQFVTFGSPIVGGHQQPLKGPLKHPIKRAQRIARYSLMLFFLKYVISTKRFKSCHWRSDLKLFVCLQVLWMFKLGWNLFKNSAISMQSPSFLLASRTHSGRTNDLLTNFTCVITLSPAILVFCGISGRYFGSLWIFHWTMIMAGKWGKIKSRTPPTFWQNKLGQ